MFKTNITVLQQNITVQYCFPDHSSSCRRMVKTGHAYIFLIIVLSCVSACTVFLNLLVIISISHFKQLHTPANLPILSLAMADLFVGLFLMPVKILEIADSCWYFGKVGCAIYPIFNFLFVSASLCSLIFIAVDWYIDVSDPLHYSTRISVCKMSLAIILGWSFSLFYNIIYLHFNDHFLQSRVRCNGEYIIFLKHSWIIADLVILFVTPCSVIIISYSIILKIARHQVKAVRAVTNGVTNSSETKAAKTMGIVIFVYLACWIPFYISSLLADSFTSVSVVWTVFAYLMIMNSSVNPLIYAIFYSWFRESVKYIVTCRIFEFSSSRINLFPENF